MSYHGRGRAPTVLNDQLCHWSEIAGGPWPALLLGNGASIAVWSGFRYDRLYETAELSADDRALFEAVRSTNFEVALDALRVSRVVCRQLGHDVTPSEERYRSIREALVRTLKDVHVPWEHVTSIPVGFNASSVAAQLRVALLRHSMVFTTNYDLLAYWALMDEANAFADYFWGDLSFDRWDTRRHRDRTRILFLHGGLHLYRLPSGRVVKRRHSSATNLLEALGTPYMFGEEIAEFPLVVTEGTSDDKLRVIRGSDYLSFGLESLAEPAGNIVVFGHSLGSQDGHVAAAIKRRNPVRIAVSLRAGEPVDVIQRKVHFQSLFPSSELVFFEASTHPLGSRNVNCDPAT